MLPSLTISPLIFSQGRSSPLPYCFSEEFRNPTKPGAACHKWIFLSRDPQVRLRSAFYAAVDFKRASAYSKPVADALHKCWHISCVPGSGLSKYMLQVGGPGCT